MRIVIIVFSLFSSFIYAKSHIEDPRNKKGFYLKQVDYRHRANFSVSLPGVRLRLRPFYEYRYSAGKKKIVVNKE